jgi:integrase
MESLFTSPTGEIWIKKQRQKTKKWSHTPLLPQAKFILDKYEYHPIRKNGYLLPMPTNQKTNAYLKEIADLCGINKNLTTHCARHSNRPFCLKTSNLQEQASQRVTI